MFVFGVDEVICFSDEDVVVWVKVMIGRKFVWGVLDVVGGEMIKKVGVSVWWGG